MKSNMNSSEFVLESWNDFQKVMLSKKMKFTVQPEVTARQATRVLRGRERMRMPKMSRPLT